MCTRLQRLCNVASIAGIATAICLFVLGPVVLTLVVAGVATFSGPTNIVDQASGQPEQNLNQIFNSLLSENFPVERLVERAKPHDMWVHEEINRNHERLASIIGRLGQPQDPVFVVIYAWQNGSRYRTLEIWKTDLSIGYEVTLDGNLIRKIDYDNGGFLTTHHIVEEYSFTKAPDEFWDLIARTRV